MWSPNRLRPIRVTNGASNRDINQIALVVQRRVVRRRAEPVVDVERPIREVRGVRRRRAARPSTSPATTTDPAVSRVPVRRAAGTSARRLRRRSRRRAVDAAVGVGGVADIVTAATSTSGIGGHRRRSLGVWHRHIATVRAESARVDGASVRPGATSAAIAASTPFTNRPRVVGREPLGQLDRLVEHHGGRHVGPLEQLEHGEPHHVEVEHRHPRQRPALGPRGDRCVERSRCVGRRRARVPGSARRARSPADRSCRPASMPFECASYSRYSARSRASDRSSGRCMRRAQTRVMYSPERVSTRILSPVSTNSGTWTTLPVSSVAGLRAPDTRSPCTPGSVSAIVSSTDAGDLDADDLAVEERDLGDHALDQVVGGVAERDRRHVHLVVGRRCS